MVDYGLARRAALTALRGTGSTAREDVCDAHPYLVLAARHHGEPTGRTCPVCRRVLEEMAHEHGEFRVYVVEVCAGPKRGSGCGWNHLVQSYVLGDGVPRRSRTANRKQSSAR